MKGRILIVEDEAAIHKLVSVNLELEGYETRVAEDGKEALSLFNQEYFDLILLDLMIPEVSGMKVLEKVKLEKPDLPVIIMSAKDKSTDRVKGLKNGAEDYINKPFNLEELLLRVGKVLQRVNPTESKKITQFSFGSNSIDFTSYIAQTKNGPLNLTQKEILLLKLFIEKKNEVIPRDVMLNTVWGYDVYPSTRTIDNFVMALRKYFEDDPSKPQFFKSVRGVGYRFEGGE